MGRQQRVGIALVLIGLLTILVMVPEMMGTTHGHATIPVAPGEIYTMGPYDFAGGNVAVWVEDYYGYYGDNGDFDPYIADSVGISHGSWDPVERETRTMDGTECVLAGGFDNLAEGEWSIKVYNGHGSTDRTNSTVEVYVIEGPNAVEIVIVATGFVMVTAGLVFVLRSRRGTGPTDVEGDVMLGERTRAPL